MIIAAKKFRVYEAPLEPMVLFVKTDSRVRRGCIMQRNKVGPYLDVDETSLVTRSREILKRIHRIRELRVIREHQDQAGELTKAECVGRQNGRREVPVEP